MLTEKYRPEILSGIKGQDDVVQVLTRFLDHRPTDIPHFLFHGKPGIGKTATAMAFANELNADYVEFNASDQRRLSDIREHIIPAMRHSFRDYKVIFLDEADRMVNEAQSALRRPLEQYIRPIVIFSCNNIGRILMPIRSRCMEFEFSPIDKKKMMAHLKEIANMEGITVDLSEIAEESEGDMRRALNLLEKHSLLETKDRYREVAESYMEV